jgi:hypothetical protein
MADLTADLFVSLDGFAAGADTGCPRQASADPGG